MLDFAMPVKENWDSITESTIARGMVKSKSLPTVMNDDHNFLFCRVTAGSEDDNVKELTATFCRLNLDLGRRDPFYEQTLVVIREVHVIEWMNVEENHEALEAMVVEELEQHLKSTSTTVPGTSLLESECGAEKAGRRQLLITKMYEWTDK